MDFIRVTAKTVEDAITEASILLGTSSDNIEYTVIEKGSSGFFGIGGKKAVIEAKKKFTDEDLMTLQYLLQRILLQIELLRDYAVMGGAGQLDNVEVPSETIRMAMAVVAAGPMLVVFPFFQKYFPKGLTVGSVKG